MLSVVCFDDWEDSLAIQDEYHVISYRYRLQLTQIHSEVLERFNYCEFVTTAIDLFIYTILQLSLWVRFSAFVSPETDLRVFSPSDYSIVFHIIWLYGWNFAWQLSYHAPWSGLSKLIAGLSAKHLTRINYFFFAIFLRLKSHKIHLCLLLFFDLFLQLSFFSWQKLHQIGIKLDLADKWLMSLTATQRSDACRVTTPKVHWVDKECVVFIASG